MPTARAVRCIVLCGVLPRCGFRGLTLPARVARSYALLSLRGIGFCVTSSPPSNMAATAS